MAYIVKGATQNITVATSSTDIAIDATGASWLLLQTNQIVTGNHVSLRVGSVGFTATITNGVQIVPGTGGIVVKKGALDTHIASIGDAEVELMVTPVTVV